jgi:hypothetical protein
MRVTGLRHTASGRRMILSGLPGGRSSCVGCLRECGSRWSTITSERRRATFPNARTPRCPVPRRVSPSSVETRSRACASRWRTAAWSSRGWWARSSRRGSSRTPRSRSTQPTGRLLSNASCAPHDLRPALGVPCRGGEGRRAARVGALGAGRGPRPPSVIAGSPSPGLYVRQGDSARSTSASIENGSPGGGQFSQVNSRDGHI